MKENTIEINIEFKNYDEVIKKIKHIKEILQDIEEIQKVKTETGYEFNSDGLNVEIAEIPIPNCNWFRKNPRTILEEYKELSKEVRQEFIKEIYKDIKNLEEFNKKMDDYKKPTQYKEKGLFI